MAKRGGISTMKLRFYTEGSDKTYRQVSIDSDNVASLGSLLDSIEVSWHGTKPLKHSAIHTGKNWCAVGQVQFQVCQGWFIQPKAGQDIDDSDAVVLARPLNRSADEEDSVVVRVHKELSTQHQFQDTMDYFRQTGFHIISSGPLHTSNNLSECMQATVVKALPHDQSDDWEHHVFFEVGGRVYSLSLYCSTHTSKQRNNDFNHMVDSIEWQDTGTTK
jgi:hypothetical protein